MNDNYNFEIYILKLQDLIEDSLNILYRDDYDLIRDKQELACAARLLFIMQNRIGNSEKYKSLKGYSVDSEYRLLGKRRKLLPSRLNGFRPDLIVHKRYHNDNLIVLELKMCSKRLYEDRIKLRDLTNHNGDYKYKLGASIVLSIDNPLIEYYVDGRIMRFQNEN
jgi:hypothetical protein